MAEVYWINGFERTLPEGQSLAVLVREWLDEIHVRIAWIDQVNVLSDGSVKEMPEGLTEYELPAGFVFSSSMMNEHFLLQQIMRRMRMDESESQLLVCKSGQICTAALFISHRQVGRYNLLPRLVMAEQMLVLQPDQLQKRLANLPEEFDRKVYLTAVQHEFLAELNVDDLENVSKISTDKRNMCSLLLEIYQDTALKDQLGLLVSQAEFQPMLVTSVQGC